MFFPTHQTNKITAQLVSQSSCDHLWEKDKTLPQGAGFLYSTERFGPAFRNIYRDRQLLTVY